MTDNMTSSLSIFLMSTFVEALSCGGPWARAQRDHAVLNPALTAIDAITPRLGRIVIDITESGGVSAERAA